MVLLIPARIKKGCKETRAFEAEGDGKAQNAFRLAKKPTKRFGL